MRDSKKWGDLGLAASWRENVTWIAKNEWRQTSGLVSTPKLLRNSKNQLFGKFYDLEFQEQQLQMGFADVYVLLKEPSAHLIILWYKNNVYELINVFNRTIIV